MSSRLAERHNGSFSFDEASRSTMGNGCVPESPASPSPQQQQPPPPPVSASPAQIEQLRQKLAYGLQSQPELRDLLGLCSESNAWSVEEATRRPDTITTMELFLLQVPRVPLVQYFPNLVTVKLMSIGLESMASLASLCHVEELWLSDNNIAILEGLDNMTKLRHLYLQGNRLTSLAGLPPLRHLRDLWLSRNRLAELTSLAPLRRLRALYVSGNPLERLEHVFSSELSHLHDVNLSGCHLCSITELRHLRQLPCIRHLWLSDPLFGDNPICRLNNYVTLTLAMIGSLDSLDGNYVTVEQRSLVESVLHKKRSYYAMRAHMLESQLTLLVRRAEGCALRHVHETGKALQQLQSCLQPIESELAERSTYPFQGKSGCGAAGGSLCGEELEVKSNRPDAASQPISTAVLEKTAAQLSRAVGTREVQERTILLKLAEATLTARAQAQLVTERLAVELHTAGNVRLENLPPDHDAYVAAAELIQGRFDKPLFEQRFGITGVEVESVRRITNRGLRLRFDDRVKELHIDLANPQVRSRFIGLFGLVPPTSQSQSACLQHMLLHGLSAPPSATADTGKKGCAISEEYGTTYHPFSAEEGVPLTNSLFFADEERLLSCCSTGTAAGAEAGRGHESGPSQSLQSNTAMFHSKTDANVLCRGQVVLYRVYLGKTVHALGGGGTLSTCSFWLQNGRVWRKDYSADTYAAYRLLPTVAAPAAKEGDGESSGAVAPASSYMWYCFDRALLLPDCVVDYVYTMPVAAHLESSAKLAKSCGTRDADSNAVAVTAGPRNAAAAALLSGVVSLTDMDADDGNLVEQLGRRVRLDAVEDALRCGDSLLNFMNWCAPPLRDHQSRSTLSLHQNTLQQIAETETAEALAAVKKVLGAARFSRLLGEGGGSNGTSNSGGGEAGQPLQARHVADYAARMGVEAMASLTLCVLRNRGLTAISQDFASSFSTAVTTLDLAHNQLTTISWAMVATGLPQLQRLNLSGNALTHLGLDGSQLPMLRVLDVSYNKLQNVEDFASIRSAMAALEELFVRGNPFCGSLSGEETVARLWMYLLPPPSTLLSAASSLPAVVRLNAHSVGAYPGTLAAQRFRRACLLPGGRATAWSASVLTRFLQWVRDEKATGSAAAASVFSIDGVTTPYSCFEHTAERLERLEAAGHLDEVLREGRTSGSVRAERSRISGFADTSPNDSDGVSSQSVPSSLAAECQTFRWCNGLLDDTHGLVGLMPQLCHLTLRGQAMTTMEPLLSLHHLERLDLSENHLTTIPCLSDLKSLRELILDFNELSGLPSTMGPLPALRVLSASGNSITLVDVSLFLERDDSANAQRRTTPLSPRPSSSSSSLEALYLTHNAIADMNVIYALRDVSSLLVLGVAGNPCTILPQDAEDDNDVRRYLIHVFPQLKVLDGAAISAAEAVKAREAHAGKVNSDLLIERTRSPPETWAAVTSLNLSHCALREVNLLEPFVSLEVLQLQHNMLLSVFGVEMLSKLTAIDLSHNRLGQASWRTSATAVTASVGGATRTGAGTGSSGPDSATKVAATGTSAAASSGLSAIGDTLSHLRRLQSLSLEANQLTDLSTLKLRLPHLKFLNVRGNELQFIQRGLENLPELRELLLDQNKLRGIGADAFVANKKLNIVSAENNTLRTTDGFQRCTSLQTLRLGANRLAELNSVVHELQPCPLKSVVFIGNPIARKSNYRATIITRFPNLAELDRRIVTPEERDKAAATRMAELMAPPNVVIDMSYFVGNALPYTAPSQLPPQQNALHLNVLGGPNVVAGGVASPPLARSRAVVVPGSGVAVPVSTAQVPLSSVRAPLGATKRGGADRFAVNSRNRPYRR